MINLVTTMPRRELWEYTKEHDPVFAELLTDCNEVFGRVELTEYKEG